MKKIQHIPSIIWTSVSSFFKQDIRTFLLRPSVASVSWALLTLELAFTGLYSSELRNWAHYPNLLDIPFDKWLETPTALLWFNWVFLFITISSIVYQRHLIGCRETESSNKIDNGISKLQEMNRTLPPLKFSYDVGKNYPLLHATVINLTKSTTATQNDIEYGIRLVLDTINALAKTFDEDSGSDYAINLMIYKDANDIHDDSRCIKNCVKFWPHATLANCSGILFLNKELSTSDSDTGRAEPDSKIESNMALPVYKVSNEERDFRHLLPGAPRAYFKEQMIVIHDTDDLLLECAERKRVDIYQETVDEIQEYFDKTGIKSFVSLPIIKVENEDTDFGSQTCIGIVNIHKLRRGILRSNHTRGEAHLAEKAKSQFYYLITPYLDLLPFLVNKLKVKCESNCK